MNTQKIWIVWISNAEYDDDWERIYDLCLSEEAAEKSLELGKQKYPENKLLIGECFAHD